MQMDGDESSNIETGATTAAGLWWRRIRRRLRRPGIPMGGGGALFKGGFGWSPSSSSPWCWVPTRARCWAVWAAARAPRSRPPPGRRVFVCQPSRPATGGGPEMQFVSRVLKSTRDRVVRHIPRHGTGLSRAQAVLFRDATRTDCGVGQAAMGPFYCPGRPAGLSPTSVSSTSWRRASTRPASFRRPTSSRTRSGTCAEPARHLGQGAADAREHEQARRQRPIGGGPNCRPTASPASGPTAPTASAMAR